MRDDAKQITAPLFRWAGSKRKLLPVLRKVAPRTFRNYVEPFVGSGCLYFDLCPSAAILGDINHELIETYRVLRSRPRELHQLTARLPKSRSFYYSLRATPADVLAPLERAARFTYLNRYSFNGVYRTNTKGEFNVPRGVRTGGIPALDSFLECAKALQAAQIVHGDFELVCELAGRDDFLYLDPPYRPEDVRNRGEYGSGAFDEQDFQRLLRAMNRARRRGVSVVLSYYDDLSVRRRFADWRVRRVRTRRHVGGFSTGHVAVHELLVSNW